MIEQEEENQSATLQVAESFYPSTETGQVQPVASDSFSPSRQIICHIKPPIFTHAASPRPARA